MSIPAELHEPLTTINSRNQVLAGRALSAIGIVFLAFDAVGKLLRPVQVVEGTVQLGWPAGTILTLGVIQVACLAIYLIPRTAVFGAILWTGYLGGAVATHLRIGNPLLSHVFFPTYVAALLWGGLWLRDRRLRELVPFRTTERSVRSNTL